MSVPQEHDYITCLLSEAPPPPSPVEEAAASDNKLSLSSSSSDLTTTKSSTTGGSGDASLNLRETELRLGLPGSHSPERKPQASNSTPPPGVTLFSPLVKSFVSGTKRGFSDAIDLGKGGALFSPRGDGVKVLGGVVSSSSKSTTVEELGKQVSGANANNGSPASKAQVVGWPPIRSFRKNTMASNMAKSDEEAEGKMVFGCLYVKVSMEGAPYLRKVDLKIYSNYMELSSALEKMFSCFTIGKCISQGLYGREGLNETSLKNLLHDSEYVLTYEDKDGDWMLVGDVPWEMFTESCKKLRIMKGSEAIGLAPRAMEKCKNRT